MSDKKTNKVLSMALNIEEEDVTQEEREAFSAYFQKGKNKTAAVKELLIEAVLMRKNEEEKKAFQAFQYIKEQKGPGYVTDALNRFPEIQRLLAEKERALEEKGRYIELLLSQVAHVPTQWVQPPVQQQVASAPEIKSSPVLVAQEEQKPATQQEVQSDVTLSTEKISRRRVKKD
ncbi:hypothetical protein [Aneurinibacillus tyrosinisolvens]|uniref:hypothetical protein n=1 Tax=Aneurinibacillus tyrosinisolvens TaxID=1443435 RepID=UPI00063EEBEF|nr:hypothetical protein [Aneurinibacillus tyrosinisolvens]